MAAGNVPLFGTDDDPVEVALFDDECAGSMAGDDAPTRTVCPVCGREGTGSGMCDRCSSAGHEALTLC